MCAHRLPAWPAHLPVEEHLGRVRRWGGPPEWEQALDRAEEILSPLFAGRWDRGWHVQDAAPAIAILIYLAAGQHDRPPSRITAQDILDFYASAPATGLSDLLAHKLRQYGHDVEHGDNTIDPLARTWDVLTRRYEPPTGVLGTVSLPEWRIGTVLETGLPELITELRSPGTVLVPRTT